MPRIRAESVEAHKKASRSAILDAALKVFLANGFSGTSLGAIADVAGLPRTTLYEYFPSKAHILLAVLEDRVPPLVEELLAGLDASAPLDRINQIFIRGVDLVLAYPELTELMFRVGRELPKELRDQMWELLEPITRELFIQCRIGVESKDFGSRHPDRYGRVLADTLLSAIDELSMEADRGAAAASILESRLTFIRGGLTGSNS